MCFYADYDWTPEVCEVTEGADGGRTRCDECHRTIHAGEWRRDVHAEEHECCLACDPDADTDRGEGGDCDHGNSFDYVCCEACHLLRQAIRRVENAEGCRGEQAEPPLGEMYDAVDCGEGWEHYADHMIALGLTRELALVPPPEPDDVFRDLAFAGPVSDRPGEYPGAWCDSLRRPADDFDIGEAGA